MRPYDMLVAIREAGAAMVGSTALYEVSSAWPGCPCAAFLAQRPAFLAYLLPVRARSNISVNFYH